MLDNIARNNYRQDMQFTSTNVTFYVMTYCDDYPLEEKPVERKPPELSYEQKFAILRKQVQLHWHRISGYAVVDEEDRNTFKNDRKYERLGWLGLSVSNFSDVEWRAIQSFVNTRKDRVWKSNRRAIEGERLWIVGDVYGEPEISVWFRFERDLKAFDRLLKGFKRSVCFLTTREPNKHCARLLKRLNHRIVRGDEQSVVSLEDSPEAMTVRLSL